MEKDLGAVGVDDVAVDVEGRVEVGGVVDHQLKRRRATDRARKDALEAVRAVTVGIGSVGHERIALELLVRGGVARRRADGDVGHVLEMVDVVGRLEDG